MDLSSNKRKDIFENNIRELLHYVDEEGCLRLPRNDYEARRLANWWCRQKKRKTISEFDREKLREVSISFDDTPRKENDDKVWDEFFGELMSYKEEFHTFVVSKKDEAHKRLRNWVIRQRRMARQETLLSKRRDTLLRAGFEFHPITCCSKKRKYTEIQRKKWDDKYAKLRTFNAQYSHCNVSYNDEQNRDLAKWVSLQRVTKGKGLMDDSRAELLEKIGFSWRIRK